MVMWEVATTDVFDAWFVGLADNQRVEVVAKVEVLKKFGPALSRPHADTLKNSRHANLKELRGDADGAVLRVLFAFDPERRAILLTGGNKSGVNEKRFYKTLIKQADALLDVHLQAIKRRKRSK
jgi:hypothetical protein